jgi:hypothetical protein
MLGELAPTYNQSKKPKRDQSRIGWLGNDHVAEISQRLDSRATQERLAIVSVNGPCHQLLTEITAVDIDYSS